MMMNLGVVITDDKYAPQAVGILQAAIKRGWQIRCFLTDSGVRLLNDTNFSSIANSGSIMTSLCETSVERYEGVDPEPLADKIVIGGQYQNAELVKNSDQILVF